VQPVLLKQEQAISYAKGGACFRSGEIRVLLPLRPSGSPTWTIPTRLTIAPQALRHVFIPHCSAAVAVELESS
jgi:hypothetical protein